jgi:hypothetical protein
LTNKSHSDENEPGWLSHYNYWLKAGLSKVKIPAGERYFLFYDTVQYVSHPIGTEVKQLEYTSYHLFLSTVEGKNECSYTSAPLICLRDVDGSNFNCDEKRRRNKEPCFIDSWTPAYHYDGVNSTARESD